MSSTHPHHALGQFLSTAIHDIKQPLNVLQMYLGILQEQAGLPKGDELTQIANGSLKSLQSMLNLLSNWARADEGGLRIQPERVTPLTWSQHLEKQEWLSHPLPAVDLSAEETHRSIDLALLTQTLRDILTLLPRGTAITATPTPWSLELQLTPPLQRGSDGELLFSDALHQLAVDGGGAVLKALGFQQRLVERDGAVVIAIQGAESMVAAP